MTHCLSLDSLVAMHIDIVCRKMGEPYVGMLNQGLLKAALARPRHARHYESADLIRQASYLFHGLLMNHGFVQGNKRTAYVALEWLLFKNRVGRIAAPDQQVIDMCLAAVGDRWNVDTIEDGLRSHVRTE